MEIKLLACPYDFISIAGKAQEASTLFAKMQEEGIKPGKVIFFYFFF